jgi:copper chaperone CopZ
MKLRKMAIRCPYCSREFDVTLFEFGRTVTCVCGNEVAFQHKGRKEECIVQRDEGGIMATLSFKVGNIYCYDCVIALKKFLASLDGIESIEMSGEDGVDISFNASKMSEEKLKEIVADSCDKLGVKILDILK